MTYIDTNENKEEAWQHLTHVESNDDLLVLTPRSI